MAKPTFTPPAKAPAPVAGTIKAPAPIVGGGHKSTMPPAFHARINKGAC